MVFFQPRDEIKFFSQVPEDRKTRLHFRAKGTQQQQQNRSTTTTLRDVLSKTGLGSTRIGTTTSNGSLSLTWLCVEQLLQAIHDQRDQQEGRGWGEVVEGRI